jgi:phosphohistidine phosphatase SixA
MIRNDKGRESFQLASGYIAQAGSLLHPGRLCALRLRSLLFAGLFTFALTITAMAQPPVIFLVRHAERAAISGHVPSDTGLSAVGRKRAEALAVTLKNAQITAIYTTEYHRTIETAAPLARSLGIRSEVVPSGDLRSLFAKLKAVRGNVLVVGHSNTLPQIIKTLGISSPVVIGESDYDNLFLVVLAKEPKLIRLHYR